MEEQDGKANGLALPAVERRTSDWGPIALLNKTKEFFRTCDVEGKGFITRKDMRVRGRKRKKLFKLFVAVGSRFDSKLLD